MTIDPGTFRDLKASAGEEFVHELVGTFLEDAPGLLMELRDAWDAKSPERFRRAAHSLKSNGETFGAADFARLARELELGGLPDNGSALDALQRSYDAAAMALRDLCRG